MGVEAREDGAEALAPSARTRLKRGKDRARYARQDVLEILAQGLHCHVGVSLATHPAVIPTVYAIRDGRLYLHGSRRNRVFRALEDGAEACICVTLLDGLVLARSAFHHSVNYRSVVLYGVATEVTEESEKRAALDALIDHMVPGRAAEARAASPQELERTLVLAIPLDEASAKVRSGPPIDEEEDYALDTWAGVIPLRTVADPPVSDPRATREVPDGVRARYADLCKRSGG